MWMEIRWLLKPPKMKTTKNKEEKKSKPKSVGGLRGKLLKAVFGCVAFLYISRIRTAKT